MSRNHARRERRRAKKRAAARARNAELEVLWWGCPGLDPVELRRRIPWASVPQLVALQANPDWLLLLLEAPDLMQCVKQRRGTIAIQAAMREQMRQMYGSASQARVFVLDEVSSFKP